MADFDLDEIIKAEDEASKMILQSEEESRRLIENGRVESIKKAERIIAEQSTKIQLLLEETQKTIDEEYLKNEDMKAAQLLLLRQRFERCKNEGKRLILERIVGSWR